MSKHCICRYQNFVLLILFSFTFLISFGQGYDTLNWKFSNPKQFGFTIQAVNYFDDNNVIAVGTEGGIAKSTDGGSNWTYGPFTYIRPDGLKGKQTFNDINYVTATTAYAVGNAGLMAKTTDGGQTWSFVTTPLFPNLKNINAVWFVDANKGYIGGQANNASDSLPKLYVTLNGGATWDSIAAPMVNGVTRVGYINNPNIPSVLYPVDAKMKEIFRIQILSNGVGYVCGQGSPLFPAVSKRAISSTNCLPGTSNLTTGSQTASLLWKLDGGVLTDYSLSKERLGYSGINTTNINCTTTFGSISPSSQSYKAMHVVNDSTVVLISFNNNVVVKVHTGVADQTANVNAPGIYEKGRYELLNFTNPPNGGTPIPPNPVFGFSNPLFIKKANSGKLYTGTAGNSFFGTPGSLYTSVDTGRTWVEEIPYPQTPLFTLIAPFAQALDFSPSGKLLVMGNNGAVGDSVPGGKWQSNYTSVPVNAGYEKIEFIDCNNGIATGGSAITVTTDGGASWIDKARPDFANSFYTINGLAYPSLSKAYFAVSNGIVYSSPDQGTTLDPIFSDFNYRMNDIAAIGNNVWAIGYSQFTVPSAQRRSAAFRSTDGGVTWSTYTGFPVGTLAPNLTQIKFPTNLIGYAAGNRDTIYKTTDGGLTWNKLPVPTPGVTPQITYTDMFALDANTVFLTGNGFPRKVVFKTTDGGNTWTDITNNISTLGGGNINAVLMHDVNNGYVVSPGGYLFKTTDGGSSWALDIAPTNCIFNTMAFAPQNVPSGISMQNRKLFVSGVNINGAPMMEYGNPKDINVNSTEVVTGGCSVGALGSIVVNATGGIAPYTYSLDGGQFQTSNTFANLTSGTKTLTIKDAFCGILTKQIVVDVKQSPSVNAGFDKTIIDGDIVTLNGNGSANSTNIAWTPANSILSGANSYNASAKPSSTTNFTLTVTAQNGCISSDDVLVTVIPYCVKVMNAFTPNGDGINDKWLVTNGASCSQQIIAKVFNRQGDLVYSNDHYNNDWDGKYKGKPVPDGTYYYVLQFRLINGMSIPVKGDVTILR